MFAFMQGQTFHVLLLHMCLSLLLLGSVTSTLVDTNSIPVWLQNLFPVNYSSDLPPVTYRLDNSVEPVVVYCSIRPEFVTTISMKTMDFEVDMQISVEWHDFRLNYVSNEKAITKPVHLTQDIAMKMWQPWLIFDNCKGSESAIVTPEVMKIGPLWSKAIHNKVGINVFYRKTFRFKCRLNFVAYPFDIQNCGMVVEWVEADIKSNNVKATGITPYYPVTVMLTTSDKPEMITVPPGFRLASLKIVNEFNNTLSTPAGSIMLIRKSIRFSFERIFAQHLMLVFLPSILIVMLSWVSFWLDVGSAAPRVALGLTTLLTLSTQFNAAQRDLPAVADIKALDIWMFTCIFMVFASMVEFAVANICHRMQPTDVQKVRPILQHVYAHNVALDKMQIKSTEYIRRGRMSVKYICCIVMRRRETTSKIDYISRIIFPVAFLIFNTIFWKHFLDRKEQD